jgi:hypothetical protein
MSEEKQPFDEQPQESANEPYQPVEDYTPPTAEPPAEMTDTTPAPELFAPPSIDASSFPGGEAAPSGQVEQPASPPPPPSHLHLPPRLRRAEPYRHRPARQPLKAGSSGGSFCSSFWPCSAVVVWL